MTLLILFTICQRKLSVSGQRKPNIQITLPSIISLFRPELLADFVAHSTAASADFGFDNCLSAQIQMWFEDYSTIITIYVHGHWLVLVLEICVVHIVYSTPSNLVYSFHIPMSMLKQTHGNLSFTYADCCCRWFNSAALHLVRMTVRVGLFRMYVML